jgi:hypothetical protein
MALIGSGLRIDTPSSSHDRGPRRKWFEQPRKARQPIPWHLILHRSDDGECRDVGECGALSGHERGLGDEAVRAGDPLEEVLSALAPVGLVGQLGSRVTGSQLDAVCGVRLLSRFRAA